MACLGKSDFEAIENYRQDEYFQEVIGITRVPSCSTLRQRMDDQADDYREIIDIAKKKGVEKLTPSRALIAELVRRYWVLGMECSFLEIQKLAWFLERVIETQQIDNPLKLQFKSNNYGPYADKLRHVLEALDGSYLKSNKRIADSNPLDVIWFDESKREQVNTYLHSDAKAFLPALEQTSKIIDGFESPFGMELLATVDWLIEKEGCKPNVKTIQQGIKNWPAGQKWANRKAKLFDERSIGIALQRLEQLQSFQLPQTIAS